MTRTPEIEERLPVALRLAVEGPLYAAIAFAPFAYGASEAWSQQIVLALVFASLLALAIGRLVTRGGGGFWTIAYAPVALLLALAWLQQQPLPGGVAAALSPGTAAIRDPILSLAGLAATARSTISLYPLATERELRLWLGGAAVFVLVSQYFAPGAPARLRRLLSCVSAVGLAVALMALWQNFAHSGVIYGSVVQTHPMSGPFANHSHLGQFLNLSMGAGIALLLIRWGELRRGGYSWAGIVEELRRPANWDVSLLILFLVAAPVAVMLSLTRGGTLSMLVAGAALLAVLPAVTGRAWRNRLELDDRPIAAGAMVGLAVVALLAAVGFNSVYDRLATLRHIDHTTGLRADLVRAAVEVAKSLPITGSGLGTHAFVYPMFNPNPSGGWATYAENEYAQLLEETGFVGLGLFLCFAGIVVAALVKGMIVRAGTAGPIGPRAALPGLMFGLLAVALHSWSDFGQHLPAIGFLTAITCGLIVRLGRSAARPTLPALDGPPAPASLPRFGLRAALANVALAAAVLGLGGWAIAGVTRDRAAEVAWLQANGSRAALDARGWELDSPTYRALIESGKRAVELQPRDAEYAFWLATWRWEAVAQQVSASGGLDEQLVGWSRRIVDDLKQATALCPTFGRPLAFAGAIELMLDDASSEARKLIDRGASLASYDSAACLTASRVATADGDRERARTLLLRAVKLGMPLTTAIDELVDRIGDADAAIELAGTDLPAQHYLAERLSERPQFSGVVAELRRKYASQLAASAARPGASVATLDQAAALEASEGRIEPAIGLLRRAVSMEYGNVERRLRLAKLYWEQNDAGQALEQAKICLRLRPGWAEAQSLIAEASLGRRAQGESPESR